MTKVYFGKIINTHGLKGELKVKSDFPYPQKVLKPNFKLYINDLEYSLKSFRYQVKNYLIFLNNYDDLNKVLPLKGKDIYLKKEDLNLKNNEYLFEDLIGSEVINQDQKIGLITDVLIGSKNNFVKVKNQDKSFLIPLINEYVIKYENKKLYTKNCEDLKNI